MADQTRHSPLITPAELAPLLADPRWVVFDCRHALTDAQAGPKAYAQGHIPGARFAHMDHDLSAPPSPAEGRHPLPRWGDFTAWLGRQGVSNASRVVVYDETAGMFASRLWWMLRVLGHENVRVLNGGLARWKREGHPVTMDVPAPSPAQFRGAPRLDRIATLEELLRHQGRAGQPMLRLVDGRVEARFEGREEPLDRVPGHIPGAVNWPFDDNLDAAYCFLPPETLRGQLLRLFAGTPPAEVVHYCGSGVSACHNLLAQEVAGMPPGRLYVGSWSQWCADPARPVALGPVPLDPAKPDRN
ncbi:MAG: sulfurtransferase [Deltaproteobacteria bacterium]|nr:sulfurtransferase [Deltaproteobacteria bacterium]